MDHHLHHHSDIQADSDVAALLHPRGILQERSANWPHERATTTTQSPQKQSHTSSPTEQVSSYPRRAAYHVPTHHINLAGFGLATPEKQLKYELEKLYKFLARSEKYQKYREKQPVLTPAQVIAKEAAEKKEALRRGKTAEKKRETKERDSTVWPEFLESAFWRALVRWPPIGRRKCMLDGALRGRNELIQDSIYMDTGIQRNRKQISSHLQVLKAQLHDQPAVLHYMATQDHEKRKRRGGESLHAHHLAHTRGHRNLQRTVSGSEYDFNGSASHYPSFGPLQSNLAPNANPNGSSLLPLYAVTDFTMLVDNDNEPVHYFTQLSSNGRLGDLRVTDTTSWRRQYPEFEFLRPHMEDWMQNDRRVLVCDASIKVMTEVRPNADLSITFNLHSQRDLSPFESLECTTRFFDSGDITPDPQFDGPNAHDLKEHRTPCDYMPGPRHSGGHLRIAFGSKFWVNRMLKYQSLRHKDESCVSRSLLRLTATQDVYGIEPGTGKAQCIMTILWRFLQTRSSAEVGSMSWRAVTFGGPSSSADVQQQQWEAKEDFNNHITSQHTDHDSSFEQMTAGREETSALLVDVSDSHSPSSPTPDDSAHAHKLYHQLHAIDFPNTYVEHASHSQHAYPDHDHSYTQDAQQHPCYTPSHTQHTPYTLDHPQHPPAIHLDILASLQPDLSASAPTTATDYTAHTLPVSAHTHEAYQNANNFDFHGGHISISDAFDPAINLSAYESFASHAPDLDALVGLDADALAGLGLAVSGEGELVALSDIAGGDGMNMCSESMGASACTGPGAEASAGGHMETMSGLELSCYSTKPNWHHINLIESLESAAEQFHAYVPQDDGQSSQQAGLWGLQSPFREDAEAGAGRCSGGNLEMSEGSGKEGTELDILEALERE